MVLYLRLLTYCFSLFDLHYQALLVSGGSDGLLVLWNADYGQDSRELVPKLSLKVIAFIFTQYSCSLFSFII